MVREKTSDEKTDDDDFDDQTRTYGIHVYDQEQEQPTIKPPSPKGNPELIAKARRRKNDSTKAILQKLAEHEQSLNEFSQTNVAEVIEESVQANMMNEVKNQLPKLIPDVVSNFIQPRVDRTVLQALKSNQISLFTTPTTSSATFTEYELKDKLYNMMFHIHSYDTYK
ncbi:hypothetical protein Tco_0256737 [Tanacetum coccineum]